ncbi:HEAT repeat domain-containing protein [Limnospira fusiformis KN01]|nr:MULTISPECIES: HEAT repeat domain-containing protein [Limnospira]MDT9187604.1 HEAT repeat domain-containing protein [Limnospira sp. PMC 894.15]MDT9198529.1 HEAT repeat domain-containing protein [Limnospira sp. PMC 1042.18]MDT9234961.1 HEAT repeat domain-containing protein [Limnospira sp. PMC 917.15]ULB48237.1 HEAT repeat domain-containing protein [Limnospira fusiformis KN01]
MKDKCIDELIDILETTTDERTRRRAAENLGQIGKGNKTAISALVNLLETTTDKSTRIQAAENLGQIHPELGREWLAHPFTLTKPSDSAVY